MSAARAARRMRAPMFARGHVTSKQHFRHNVAANSSPHTRTHRARTLARPPRSEDGFAGGFEGLLFGMLIFVAGTLLVAYAWGVVDTKTATGEAARQAARTYVEAPDAAAATGAADQAAAAALAGYGRDPAKAQVQMTQGAFARCDRITITVSYPAPLFRLPFLGSLGRGPAVTSRHSELVDPYRSGLPGTASCA